MKTNILQEKSKAFKVRVIVLEKEVEKQKDFFALSLQSGPLGLMKRTHPEGGKKKVIQKLSASLGFTPSLKSTIQKTIQIKASIRTNRRIDDSLSIFHF